MSEIDSDISSGSYCQICGEYIGEVMGYPRTCQDCKGLDKDENLDDDDENLEDEEYDESYYEDDENLEDD